jgi:DNA-binding NarL/FixJ family response regulator
MSVFELLNLKRLVQHRPDGPQERPLVLLALHNKATRAMYAYGLSANGFDVMMTGGASTTPTRGSAPQPDVIVVDLPTGGDAGFARILGRDVDTDDVPIVALIPNLGTASCDRARQAGCAAVCLTTCTADVLASGLRAVLERAARLARRVNR